MVGSFGIVFIIPPLAASLLVFVFGFKVFVFLIRPHVRICHKYSSRPQPLQVFYFYSVVCCGLYSAPLDVFRYHFVVFFVNTIFEQWALRLSTQLRKNCKTCT